MRFILTAVLLLAIPAAVHGQQAADGPDTAEPAAVQLEQSVTTEVAPAPATIPVDGVASTRAASSDELPAGDAAVQDPGSRQWWYIVGAVVVGGLILALVL